MADRSSNVLTDLTDRRNALRVLGAASTAFVAALGLGGATGEARGQGGLGKGKEKSHRNQPTRPTRDKEGGKRPAERGDEPAEPGGGATTETASTKSASVEAQRKKRRFASQKVQGDLSAPLSTEVGSQVFSRAFCPGGKGKLLGGGYSIDGTSAQLVNVIVIHSAPDDGAGSFAAVLRRTSDSGNTAGATIQAFAICKA
jgi:hypothetical protein